MQNSLARLLVRWLARAVALAILALWAQQTLIPTFQRTDTRRDMVLYYLAARSVRAGASLYTPRPGYGPDSKPFEYLYPPPFAAVIAPLGALPWLVFARLWTVGLLLAFAGYALCLRRLSGARGVWPWVVWTGVLCLFPGASRAVALGQIDPALWFLSGLSVWAVTTGQARAVSGAALGLASLVKIYAAWPLFAVKRGEGRRRIWGGAVIIGALGLALGALVCGAQSYAQWARAVLPVAGQGTFNPDNFSFSMGVLRVAQSLGWNYAGGPLTGLPKMWLSFAAIAGPLLALLATRRLTLRWRVALITCAAAWCAPLCWSTYLPLALLPIALAWAQWAPQSGANERQT